MHDKIILYLKNNWLLWFVLLLVILNLCLVWYLLFSPEQESPEPDTETQQTIQQLYMITDGLGDMESVMQLLTLHGSVQYYADEENWLYFEQMAGGFRMMLGKNAENISYWEYEENHIRYTCIEETLGTELIWEDENGYMFYLYSSLDIDSLLNIARSLQLRPESEGNA